MGLLNVIRRMALREQLPIREIARRTGLSRNTVKKYLKAGTIEPKFTTPERPSKLDPFAEKLAGWLKIEGSKSASSVGRRSGCMPTWSHWATPGPTTGLPPLPENGGRIGSASSRRRGAARSFP
jgi:hypothetical protein